MKPTYFKSLELIGFKSFADKTEFSFEPGITAVVGPNGCGKTNVADAVRWVLGEQSPSALRARRMDDCIFSGTADRKGMGFAEASLRLANAENGLQTDYEDVVVTRRLFRSGESEYLLNGAPCRLRDITDLFMDTGIGTASYSIMAQGKVDLVLTSKPEERRYLFDEAAGITKYKARKNEALRKLAATDQNLVRLRDIITEVRRQLGSMKRQVAKAERHRVRREALIRSETELGVAQLHRFNVQVEQADAEVNAVGQELETVRLEASRRESGLETVRLEAAEADQKVAGLQRSVLEASRELSSIEQDAAVSKERADTLSGQAQRAARARERLEEHLAELNVEMCETGQRLDVLVQQRVQKEGEAVEHEAEVSRLAREIAGKQRSIEDAKKEIVETAREESMARSALMDIKVALEKAEAHRRRLEMDRSRAEREALETSARRELAAAEAAKCRQQLDCLKERSSRAAEAIALIEQKVKELADVVEKDRSELKEHETERALLEDQKRKYEGYDSGVKSILQAPVGELRGVRGALAELLRLPGELEAAVEAALGADLQALVVDRESDADAAMAFLKDCDGGRAVFYALDLVRDAAVEQVSLETDGSQDILGILGEMVRLEGNGTPLLSSILGGTVLVRDLEAGRRVRELGLGRVIVTLAGERLDPCGRLSGGAVCTGSVSLLRREERILECVRAAELISCRIGENETARAGAREEQRCMELQQAAVEKDARLLEMELHKLQAQEATASQDEVRARDFLGTVRVEWTEADEEVSVLEEEAPGCRGHLDRAEQERVALEQSVADALTQIDAWRAERERMSDVLTAVKVEATALGEREQAVRSEMGRSQDVRDRDAAISAGLQKEIEDWLKEREELVERVGRLATQRADRAAGLSGLEEELACAEKARREVLDTIRTSEDEMRVMRAAIGEKQESLSGAEIRRNELGHLRSSLCERLQVEYRIDLESEAANCMPGADLDEEALAVDIEEKRGQLEAMGPVNTAAISENEELEERRQFLEAQQADLDAARDSLHKAIARINKTTRQLFIETFEKVNTNFGEIFRTLFGGGKAELVLVDESNITESGIEIIARPPGKRPQTVALLSGGERAMVAVALLFAIFKVKPSPFCMLDEIDAPLDDANIGRFVEMLRSFTEHSQFIVITHSKRTIAAADVIYGVTMEESGVSRLVSVRMAEPEMEKAAV